MNANPTTGWCSIIPGYALHLIVKDEQAAQESRKAAQKTIEAGEVLYAKATSGIDIVGTDNDKVIPISVNGRPPPGDSKDCYIWTANSTQQLPGELCSKEGLGTMAVSVSHSLGRIQEFFRYVFGWKLFDNIGNQLHVTMEYGQDCNNTYWNGSQVIFGTGWRNPNPTGKITGYYVIFELAEDILAHEMTHGIISQTSGLHYRDEPGALNEHLADVFAVLYSQYRKDLDPEDVASWTIGRDMYTKTGREAALADDYSVRPAGGLRGYVYPKKARRKDVDENDKLFVLRSLADPQQTHPRQASRYPRPPKRWARLPYDNGGVHYYSGIPNLAFYTAAMAAGGKAHEGVGQVWFAAMIDPRLRPDSAIPYFAALTLDCAKHEYSHLQPAIAKCWEWVEVKPSTLPIDDLKSGPSHNCPQPIPKGLRDPEDAYAWNPWLADWNNWWAKIRELPTSTVYGDKHASDVPRKFSPLEDDDNVPEASHDDNVSKISNAAGVGLPYTKDWEELSLKEKVWQRYKQQRFRNPDRY